MNPRVNVIIINRNRKEETARAIQSVLDQDYKNITITVWDNGSTDGSWDYLLERFPINAMGYAPENGGVAYPSNWCAKDVPAEYLFFLDNDAWLEDKNYLSIAVEYLETIPECAIIFGMTWDDIKTDMVLQWSGVYGIDPYLRSPCGTFNGSGCLIRKSAWDEVGGYNETYFAYYLETDLAARLAKKGWHIIYNPDLVQVHEQTQKARDNCLMNFYMIRNHFLFHIEHMPRRIAIPQCLKWLAWSIVHSWRQPDIILAAWLDVLVKWPKHQPTNDPWVLKCWTKLLRS